MSDIGSIILSKLIELFFTPIPTSNNATGWSILATNLPISPGGKATHLDPMDLSGIPMIELLKTTISSTCILGQAVCAGAGVQLELGVLSGLAGMLIDIPCDCAPSLIITTPITNGFQYQIPVIIPSIEMTGLEVDVGQYAGLCDCDDTPNDIPIWEGWTSDIPSFLLTSGQASTSTITITINYTITGNNLTLLLSQSNIKFSNTSIGIFNDWCVGLGLPCIPVSDANSQIGNLIEGLIPSNLLQMPDIIIPIPGSMMNKPYKDQIKENFCPLCIAPLIALVGVGTTGAGALTKEEKDKKTRDALIWTGVSILATLLIWLIFTFWKKGCKECII